MNTRDGKRRKRERRGKSVADWYVEAIDQPARAAADRRLAAWLDDDPDNADAMARCEAAVEIVRRLESDAEVGWAFRDAARLAGTPQRTRTLATRWLGNPALAWSVAGACAVCAVLAFATRGPETAAETGPAGSPPRTLSIALAAVDPVVALPNQVIVDAHSVAVLPFVVEPAQGGDTAGSLERLSAVLHGDVVRALAAIPGIYAASRESVLPYAALDLGVPEIAAQLGVRGVVEGTIAAGDDRLRVKLRFTDAASGELLLESRYERPVAELDDIREEMTTGIALALAHSSRPALAASNQ